MLPQKYRLPLSTGVRFLGHSHHLRLFQIVSRPNHLTHSRLAIILKKTVIPNAVTRNRIKRRLHALFYLQSPFPPYDYLVIVKSCRSLAEQNQIIIELRSLWSTPIAVSANYSLPHS